MKQAILAFALSAAALSAQAGELNYNYIEGNYTGLAVEDIDMDGFGIKGSFEFIDNIYAFGSYRDVSDSGLHFDETNIGVGYAKKINAKTDWINELSYVYNGAHLTAGPNVSGSGYQVATGLRSMVSDKFELVGKVNYTDVADFGSGFGANAGAVYHVNEMFGLNAGYDYSNRDNADVNGWSVGARYSF